MIDIHCHILPNIDDGSKDIGTSLAMAREAASEGITQIIATPHHRNGHYTNTKSEIISYVQVLNNEIKQAQIPISILPGQETRINGEMVEDYEKGELLTLNDTERYLFVELPSNDVPRYTKQLLFDLRLKGITPIIVHPERNRAIIENPNRLYRLVRDGVLTQVTASSITGGFGKKIKNFTLELIEHSLTHFVASDAHNLSSRTFNLKKAYEKIGKEFDSSLVEELKQNAELLVQGEELYVAPPEEIRKKKRFGLF